MWERRYQAVLKKIGTPALLALPEQVKAVLKSTTDLKVKVKMLELIERYMNRGGN